MRAEETLAVRDEERAFADDWVPEVQPASKPSGRAVRASGHQPPESQRPDHHPARRRPGRAEASARIAKNEDENNDEADVEDAGFDSGPDSWPLSNSGFADDDFDDQETACMEEFVGSEFQARPDNRRPGVYVPDWALAATTNGIERLVLGQLAYWFGEAVSARRPRARRRRAGYYWAAKTYRDLAHEVGL